MTRLNEALRLADLGFFIFPVEPGGKKPLIKDWENGATRDGKQIREWWSRWPDANVGAAPDRSDHFVIDLDVKGGKNGIAAFKTLASADGCPKTLVVKTPTDGRHLWFKGKGRSSAGTIAPGVDVRGKGGYVLMPPSMVNGTAYSGDLENPIADAPSWLVKLVNKPKRQPRKVDHVVQPDQLTNVAKFTQLLAEKPQVPEGARNDHSFKLACEAKDLGIAQETATAMMAEWNAAGADPLPDDEMRTAIGSAYSNSQNEFGSKSVTPGDVFGDLSGATKRNQISGALPDVLRQVLMSQSRRAVYIGHGGDVHVAKGLIALCTAFWPDGIVYTDGEFYIWNGRAWVVLPRSVLEQTLHDLFDGRSYGENSTLKLTSTKIKSILERAAVECGVGGFFDGAPDGFAVNNGFLSFGPDGAVVIEPGAKEQRQRYVAPYNYNPGIWGEFASASAPLLATLLNGSFKGDLDAAAKVDLVAEMFGAVLLGNVTRLKQPKTFFLIGHRNCGKSQIARLAEKLLPGDGVTHISPDDFSNEYKLADLARSRLNTRSELGERKSIASERFKEIIVGDGIAARPIYQRPFYFKPRALHIFSANELPVFTGGFDGALQRRIIVLPFNRPIPPEEQVAEISDRIAAEEGEQLLAFAIYGAQRLLRQGGFSEPASSVSALNEWAHSADVVQAFLDDSTTFDPRVATWKDIAYATFRDYAKGNGHVVPSAATFASRLYSRDARIKNGKPRGQDGKQHPAFMGLALNSGQGRVTIA